MAAPKGNRYWKQRHRHGRHKKSYLKIIQQTVYTTGMSDISDTYKKGQEQGFLHKIIKDWDVDHAPRWADTSDIDRGWRKEDLPDWPDVPQDWALTKS